MKNKLTILGLALVFSLSINAQTVFGKWRSVHKETGKTSAIIEVYQKKDGKTYAKIIDLLPPNVKDALCDKCKDYRKDKPIIGMNILSGLKKDGDQWSDGEILDPETGDVYACYIELVKGFKLKVKGHLKGLSFIGKTVYWHRLK